MKVVLRFAMVAVVTGAFYWFLHQVLWQGERPTWVAALAWGAWMAAFGIWSERRQRTGKSIDSPAFSLVAGLALSGLGIACLFESTRPEGSRVVVAGIALTGLGLFCVGSGFQAWRHRKTGSADTIRPSLRGGAVLAIATALGGSTLAAQAAAPPVAAKTLVRIDADAENLSAISTLAVGKTGTLAVYLRQDGVIRLFGPTGKALGTAGHKGAGPGEFRRLDAMGWIGDTLWVSDPVLRRLTRYRADGRLLRSVPFPLTLMESSAGADSITYSINSLQTIYPDGSFLFQAGRIPPRLSPAPKDVAMDPRYAVRASAEGNVRLIVATDPENRCTVTTREMIIAVGICARTLRAAAPDGSRRVSVLQTTPASGTGVVRVLGVSPIGGVLVDHSVPVRLIPVPAALRDTILDEMPGEARSKVAELVRHYPPAFDVAVATSGEIWVGLYAPTGQLREWRRLDAKGKALPSVWLPVSAKGLAIDARGAWAVVETEDGSQGIVLFEARQP
jgi:hypothetical protein